MGAGLEGLEYADLELSLREVDAGEGRFAAELRLLLPGGAAEARLLEPPPPVVRLDPGPLLELRADPAAYGALLSERLFADPRLREGVARARAAAAGAGAALRLRLRLDPAAAPLHGLAWETLQDPDGGGFLFTSERVLLSRYLDAADLTSPAPRRTGALRVVVAVAGPAGLDRFGLAPVDVPAEVARVRGALGDAAVSVVEGPVTLARLAGALREAPDVLYLVCHGTLLPSGEGRRGEGGGESGQRAGPGEAYLWLEGVDGGAERVAGEDLVRAVAGLPRRPPLVILVSCESAGRTHSPGVLAAVGPRLAGVGVGAVLAMQDRLTLATAERLLPAFFAELRRDGQVDRALAAARLEVRQRPDWWVPVLYLRLRDGRLWAPAPAEASGAPGGGRGAGSQAGAPGGPGGGRAGRNRQRMLERVRRVWVEGVLERSLGGLRPQALQLEERPDAVSDRWGPALEEAGPVPRALPTGTALAEVFDAHDGELLLLGEPGAGKTTLLLQLAATLIERAQRDGSLPIPVVFPLAPWAAHRGSLEAWLVEELSLRYDVPRRLAREWVAHDEVLPLLDGLDELPVRVRGACVTAIDAFRGSREGGFLGLVVTSRRAEYESLAERLGVAGAVLVRPLGPDEVERFLEGAEGQLDGVRAALRADATLRQLATSPLLLGVMALAYQGAPAAALPAQGPPEARRAQLFATYVARMLARRRAGAGAGYPEEETRRRLAWLAQALTRQAQTVLYLENLQPEWLTGAAQRRRYAWLDRLGAGLLGALLLGGPLGALFGAPAGPSGAVLGALAGGLAGGALSGLLGGAGVGGGAAGGAVGGATPAGGTGAAAGAGWGGLRGAVLGMLSTAGAAWLAGAVWIGLSGRVGGVGLYGGVEGEASEQLSAAFAGMGVLGLIFGLAGGLAGFLAGGPGLGPRRITVVETLRWSAARGRRAAVRGVVLPTVAATGLALALLVGALLAGGPATGLPGELLDPRALFLFVMLFAALMGVAVGLPFGVVAGLLFGVIGGLEPGEVETSVRPNQGIRRSARTALRAVGVALAGVLAVGLLLTLAGVLAGLLGGLLTGGGVGEPGEVALRVLARMGGWLIFGLPLALAAGLVYGGYACLSHGALRLVLWRTGALPLDCVPFLDYSVERVLLRRVGGGYMFVHRLLQEHFATAGAPGGAGEEAPREENASLPAV